MKKVSSIAKIKIDKEVVEFICSMLGGRKMRRTEENKNAKEKAKIVQEETTKNAETLAAVHTHTHRCFK